MNLNGFGPMTYAYHKDLAAYLSNNGFKKWYTIWNRCNIATGIRYNGLTCCFITLPNMGSYHREGNGPHLLGQFCFSNAPFNTAAVLNLDA